MIRRASRTTTVRCLPCLLLMILGASDVGALGVPLTQVSGRWTPTRVDQIEILAMRLYIVPSMDESRQEVVWSVDETLEVFNASAETIEMTIGVPNAWSGLEPGSTGLGIEDFWTEVFVNGQRQETQLIEVLANPAYPGVAYRVMRRFRVRIGSGEAAHIRLRFGLPAERSELGEHGLKVPFRLTPLWGGRIAAGVVTVRWTDTMFAFRSNLSAYSHYSDRVEWFLHDFEPVSDLELQFLSRQALFTMVARELRCPMPWEVMDRVADGDYEALQQMLAPYTSDQLEMCAALPPTLHGSAADARTGGLTELDISQFAPGRTDISGPILIENPDYDEALLGESESLYVRFLRQELANRR